jgi:Phage capsid-like protein
VRNVKRDAGIITPRWLVRLLDWKPIEAGTFRRNRVDESKVIESTCSHEDESVLASTFVDYEESPREYRLSNINAVLNVHTRVSDILSSPMTRSASSCAFWLKA